MNAAELLELDAWIAEHVMMWKRVKKVFSLTEAERFWVHPDDGIVWAQEWGNRSKMFKPTTNPADAMAVLEKCVKKLDSDANGFEAMIVQHVAGNWFIGVVIGSSGPHSESESLTTAICLFSKQLFSKP